jgi:hypothetical protein
MKWSLTLSSLILLSQPSSRMHSLHMVQFRWFLTYALPAGRHTGDNENGRFVSWWRERRTRVLDIEHVHGALGHQLLGLLSLEILHKLDIGQQSSTRSSNQTQLISFSSVR